jgi:pimeloyl-ACP methyl ester carboxylesterase
MPLDARSGVYYEVHGHGAPLFLGFPIFASYAQIFGEAQAAAIRDGFLSRLTDKYRVLLVDYPSIGASTTIAPAELTADRVCADHLSVADAAGFERFAYWGYTFGAATGLQLATRTERLSALVIGGWTPLGGPYGAMALGARTYIGDPPAAARVVLRSPQQYAQWATFWSSLQSWPEEREIRKIRCPRLAFAGEHGDTEAGGIPIPYASTLAARRAELEALGWTGLLFAGHGHGVGLEPAVVVPAVRHVLDPVLESD